MTIDAARSQRDADPHGNPGAPPDREFRAAQQAQPAPPTPPTPGRTKERRRPLLIAAMVALVCLGALVSSYAYLSTSETQDVVAVRESVPRGEVIEAADLMTVQVGLDPALSPLSASELESLVGQRAAVDLSAGSLVTVESVTEDVLPAEGQSIVGVSLTSAMMPSEPIYAGDAVRIVSTPGEAGEIREGTAPVTVEATVVGVRQVTDTGETVVDVAVSEDQAADLAARAATRKVALVLDSRER